MVSVVKELKHSILFIGVVLEWVGWYGGITLCASVHVLVGMMDC